MKKSIQIAELMDCIRLAGRDLDHALPGSPRVAVTAVSQDRSRRQRIFLAGLCGALQSHSPELAIALAIAAGMPHLVAPSEEGA